MRTASIIILMMEAVSLRNSETSVYFQQTTRRYIQEGCHVRIFRRLGNLKPQVDS
jgi:hypothetical protein